MNINWWYNPESFQEWTLRTKDQVNIFVREIGIGETVVVLHGGWGAEHSYMLDPLLPFQNQVHFVFYDQRGSLRSPCPASKITLHRHVEDLEQLRKELKIDRLSLLCHSMGSYLGMQYAKQYPEKVKKLILLSPVPFYGTVRDLTDKLEPVALERWKREEVIRQLAQNNIKGDDLSMLSSKERSVWHQITFSAINLHSVLHWKKMRGCFYYQGKAGNAAGSSMPKSWDFSDLSEQIGLDIQVILGDDDYIPHNQTKKSYEFLPADHLHVLHDAGHVCWIDKPNEFVEIISHLLVI